MYEYKGLNEVKDFFNNARILRIIEVNEACCSSAIRAAVVAA